MVGLMSDSHLPKIVLICFNESLLKNMKALLVYKIFRFLSSLFDQLGKWLNKKAQVNFKFYDVKDLTKNNNNTNITQNLKNFSRM